MRKALLIHNPTAGDEDHSKKELLSLIKRNGFDCNYISTKEKHWEDGFKKNKDFLIIAGGDGTVRKVIKELLNKKLLDKDCPLALIPLGTANNIAKTLKIDGTPDEIISSWRHADIKTFDVGRIHKIKKEKFFLESFGYGLFPFVMKEMHDNETGDNSEESIIQALKTIYEILKSFQPVFCELKTNSKIYSGKFILAEIMNTQLIGPNLNLSPSGDPGDGELEIILISEEDKEKFTSYILNKIRGVEETYHFETLKTKEVLIKWHGPNIHADDDLIEIEDPVEARIEIKKELLQFLVRKE